MITKHNQSRPEEWRPVVGSPDYLVSDRGNVASLKGAVAKLLNPFLKGDGDTHYPAVTIRQDGQRRIRTVHSLVAEAFIGPRPEGHEVRHLNGDSSDARLSNICYGTHAANMQDRLAHGNHPMVNKTHCLRGHEFTDDNTLRSGGRRYCRTCKRDRRQAGALRAANVRMAVSA